MNDTELSIDMERYNTRAAERQRDEAVHALKEIYRIRGEDPDIARLANQVLDHSWAQGG